MMTMREFNTAGELREHYRAVRCRVQQWKPFVPEPEPVPEPPPEPHHIDITVAPDEETAVPVHQQEREPEPEFVRKHPSVHRIVGVVCARYNLSRTELQSDRRTNGVCRPRHIAMYLAKQLTLHALSEIGRHIGKRDHTTVLHGVNKIAAARLLNADLDAELTELEIVLGGK